MKIPHKRTFLLSCPFMGYSSCGCSLYLTFFLSAIFFIRHSPHLAFFYPAFFYPVFFLSGILFIRHSFYLVFFSSGILFIRHSFYLVFSSSGILFTRYSLHKPPACSGRPSYFCRFLVRIYSRNLPLLLHRQRDRSLWRIVRNQRRL